MRDNKVVAIRSALSNGSYKFVSSMQIAESIVDKKRKELIVLLNTPKLTVEQSKELGRLRAAISILEGKR